MGLIGGTIVGGGLAFGLSKAFHASVGWTIVWTILGVSAGGLVGYEMQNG